MFVILAGVSAWQVLFQLRRDSYQNISDMMLEVDQLFLGHPELRPYFYESRAPEQDIDLLFLGRIRSVAEFLTDFIDNGIEQKRYFSNKSWQTWRNFIISLYQTSPALSTHLDAHPDWYTDELMALANEARGPSGKTPRQGAATSVGSGKAA